MSSQVQASEKPKVVIATHNRHKFVELKVALDELPHEFLPLCDWNLEPVEETGKTFVENALLKARHACRCTSLPAIADDSGLVVDLLGGEPGFFSSRYAGVQATDEENNSLLIERVNAKRSFDKPVVARFEAALVYLDHDEDPNPIIAEGTWHGSIEEKPRGNQGFGYDPLFLPLNSSLTAAELGPIVKNQESHRAQAARTLVPVLLNRKINS